MTHALPSCEPLRLRQEAFAGQMVLDTRPRLVARYRGWYWGFAGALARPHIAIALHVRSFWFRIGTSH
jgi:hypothetical protein